MRYYLYVSDAKLEMLYEQIPLRAREKLAAELNINFAVVHATFRSETVADARHQKILMVERHLRRRIGALDEECSYVADTAVASWGPFRDYTDVVYFGGFGSGVHFGLMGSMSNCIGAPNAEPTGYSLTRYILRALSRRKVLPAGFPSGLNYPISAEELNAKAFEGVVMANQCSIEPREKIQFLARTVLSKRSSDDSAYSVYIGSPIYVAACDHEF